MTWNYRVIKRTYPDGTEIYTIHEVYYKENGEPEYVTENSCYPQGETLEELKGDIALYRKALENPVLNYEDFGSGSGIE